MKRKGAILNTNMGEIENPGCPCDWPCERHGKCSECQAYHRECGDRTCCGASWHTPIAIGAK